MADETEEQIEFVCTLSWPARNQEGTFQKTIGRPTDAPVVYPMPGFPISLLHDAGAFERFCDEHLAELRARVQDPWEFWFEVLCDDALMRLFLPPFSISMTFGPFLAHQLSDAPTILRVAADSLWARQIQTHEAASIEVLNSTGMTIHALHDLYRWLWRNKDGAGDDLEALDDRLRTGYVGLAKTMLRRGDDEAAAQYAKVAFDLSPTDDMAEELLGEFSHLSTRWDKFAAAKENIVKKVATIAREGYAEWINLVSDDYYREGLIAPITEEIEYHYSAGEMKARRQEIAGMSSTNPYRRGLEMMEKVETELGFTAAMLVGMITEWPLEELRRRAPISTVNLVRRGSPWAPNTRLERLAELSYAEARQPPFSSGAMPCLQMIHEHLDHELPGIMTYALEQLPDN